MPRLWNMINKLLLKLWYITSQLMFNWLCVKVEYKWAFCLDIFMWILAHIILSIVQVKFKSHYAFLLIVTGKLFDMREYFMYIIPKFFFMDPIFNNGYLTPPFHVWFPCALFGRNLFVHLSLVWCNSNFLLKIVFLPGVFVLHSIRYFLLSSFLSYLSFLCV